MRPGKVKMFNLHEIGAYASLSGITSFLMCLFRGLSLFRLLVVTPGISILSLCVCSGFRSPKGFLMDAIC